MVTTQDYFLGAAIVFGAALLAVALDHRFGPCGRLAARYPVGQCKPVLFQAYGVSMECGLRIYSFRLTLDFSEDSFTARGTWLSPSFCVPKSAIRDFRRAHFGGLDWIEFRVDDCHFHLLSRDLQTSLFDELE